MVVMSGEAMTAGSRPIFLASSGSTDPTTFAIKTVMAMEMQTTSATVVVTLVFCSSR